MTAPAAKPLTVVNVISDIKEAPEVECGCAMLQVSHARFPQGNLFVHLKTKWFSAISF